jgi:hypothetical protein
MNMVKFSVKVVDVSVRLMGGPVREETTEDEEGREGEGGEEGDEAHAEMDGNANIKYGAMIMKESNMTAIKVRDRRRNEMVVFVIRKPPSS